MAVATGTRKTVSIHDYPEHLNPFREEEVQDKTKFWTLTKKLNRSNSINFSGLKDFKNSWAYRSFIRKGKKKEKETSASSSSTQEKTKENGDGSPIAFRRSLQYSSKSISGQRNTLGHPEQSAARPDRYVYGGSITPLPRSRFQERLRSTSQHEVSALSLTPRMARSEVSGSRLSMESQNPFDEPPVPPVRASRRKKKRAAPAPPGLANISTSSEATVNSTIDEKAETKHEDPKREEEIENIQFDVELKIVEDEDIKNNNEGKPVTSTPIKGGTKEIHKSSEVIVEPELNLSNINTVEDDTDATNRSEIKTADSTDNIISTVEFPKIDIIKYRRNSSVNEDDIKLRRGNLEDIRPLTQRSKSLTNNSTTPMVTYDINLDENDNDPVVDQNGNDAPKKVICKLYSETPRKLSTDQNSMSSTEYEFIEIDKVRQEYVREINKLNAALADDDFCIPKSRSSVSEIKRKFDTSPNPIPKPRRANHGDSSPPPVNGNA